MSTRMFINKDGQVYSADEPASPDDVEKLGPDEHMLGALDSAAAPVWPHEADAGAILKKKIAFGNLVEIVDPEPRAPLPGSANYPDEPVEMPAARSAPLEEDNTNALLAAAKRDAEEKKPAEAQEGSSPQQASLSRAQQLAAEARAKAQTPVAETSAL